MAFLQAVIKLFRALVTAVALMHKACKIIDRMNEKVQASNASDAVKTASTNFKAAADTFCDLLQAHKDDYADGQLG